MLALSGPADAAGLENYLGTATRLGMTETRETSAEATAGAALDWGLSENAFATLSLDYARHDQVMALAAKYAFPATEAFVRTYAGAGFGVHTQHGVQPDVMLGVVLGGLGTSNLIAEIKWRKVATDAVIGVMSTTP